MVLEWEEQVLVAGVRTVDLEIKVSAGTIAVSAAYLAVDEIAL